MSKTIQQILKQKKKQAEVSENITQDIAERYLSDLKEKEYKRAYSELHQQLIESTNMAEMEAAKTQIQALMSERDTIKESLNYALSEVAQLKDLIKALRAEVKVLSEVEIEDDSKELEEKELEIKQLKEELMRERNKPVPAPQIIKRDPMPSFEFKPVRGPNGMIESVKATPI